eukprot:SAG31_NODE_33636_length_340_cov_1.202479_1_plen_28_part_10
MSGASDYCMVKRKSTVHLPVPGYGRHVA